VSEHDATAIIARHERFVVAESTGSNGAGLLFRCACGVWCVVCGVVVDLWYGTEDVGGNGEWAMGNGECGCRRMIDGGKAQPRSRDSSG